VEKMFVDESVVGEFNALQFGNSDPAKLKKIEKESFQACLTKFVIMKMNII